MDPNSMTARLTFKQAGLATMGLDAAWDRAVQRYLRCETLYYASEAFGAMAKDQERHTLEKIAIEAEFGRDWKAKPEAVQRHDASLTKLRRAEDQQVREFAQPYWRAAGELALTPAQSLAAAMFKAAVMEQDEVDNNRDFPGECMEILQADFARLSRKT